MPAGAFLASVGVNARNIAIALKKFVSNIVRTSSCD